MTLIRGSLDHTIVQHNQKIVPQQMIQDPFMFDGEHNTQRADSISFFSQDTAENETTLPNTFTRRDWH